MIIIILKIFKKIDDIIITSKIFKNIDDDNNYIKNIQKGLVGIIRSKMIERIKC